MDIAGDSVGGHDDIADLLPGILALIPVHHSASSWLKLENCVSWESSILIKYRSMLVEFFLNSSIVSKWEEGCLLWQKTSRVWIYEEGKERQNQIIM